MEEIVEIIRFCYSILKDGLRIWRDLRMFGEIEELREQFFMTAMYISVEQLEQFNAFWGLKRGSLPFA